MRSGPIRTGILPLLVVSVAGCGDLIGPSREGIEAHRAIWISKGLTSYSYEYELTGFFNNLAGHKIRLEVRADTVRSAVFVETGDTVPASLAGLPTINGLFDWAVADYNAGHLTAISYDAELGYPKRMDISGPPDAAGSVFAAQVVPLAFATRVAALP